MDNWKNWYKLFELVVELHAPEVGKVEEGINMLYQLFNGIPAFDLAYSKWHE